jgi:heavy metal sensor kinase
VKRLSLRVRLTLVFALAMAVLLAVGGTFLYLRLQGTLDEQIDQSLRTRADDVTAVVRRDDSALQRSGERLVETEESFAQVIAADYTVRDATPPLRNRPLLSREELARALRGTRTFERDRIRGVGDSRFRLLATPAESRGERVVVVVGAALDDRDDALSALRTQLVVGGPIALVLASLAGFLLAAGALRPVEAMRRRAAEISDRIAGHRLPVPAADDEVARLARTLNEMLERLEAGIERERRFVADASHELRTPLSLLKTELELALRRPRSPEELHAALTSAAEETDRLVRLANDLLVLASADEGKLQLDRESVPVHELLNTLAERFAARAAASGRALETDAPADLVLAGDRLRLEQALGNVVDNALRHGAGTVRLEGARENGWVALRVRDEGSGFAPGYLPQAFERFSRADESRTDSGSGLGLALVDAIVRAHGGSVAAANGEGGGATVILLLPAHLPLIEGA